MLTDPLSISFEGKGVDTSIPVLAEGDAPFQIAESVIRPNKAQDGYNWHLKLALTEPRTATDGKPINVNFPVFMDIALQPRPDTDDKEAFKKQIFATQDAISGTDSTSRLTFDNAYVQSVVGKTVIANISIDEYPKGSGNFNNKVRRLKTVK